MNFVSVIIENTTSFLVKNEIIRVLFLIVYLGTIIAIVKQIFLRKCSLVVKSIGILLSFSLAFGAYIKVSRLMDTWLVLQISDECYATENRNFLNVVSPALINEGGSASAFMELVRIYHRTDETSYLKKMIENQLSHIYSNIERAKSYADVQVCCHSHTQWYYQNPVKGVSCKQIEQESEFDVTNVIAQLREPNYWQTRLTTAKYLTNKNYLETVRNNEKNFELMRGGDYAKMLYDNLIYLIKTDPSLTVRKSALDTFTFWVCLEDKSSNCSNFFSSNNIYNFELNGGQWEKKIVDNFNRTIGLSGE